MATIFQKKVWQKCKKIPSGKITTYRLLAKAVNESKAGRAVGQALNKNPYAPKVPCHRVVKSDGTIGGFAAGKKKKRRILRKEGIVIKGNKITAFKKYLYRY